VVDSFSGSPTITEGLGRQTFHHDGDSYRRRVVIIVIHSTFGVVGLTGSSGESLL